MEPEVVLPSLGEGLAEQDDGGIALAQGGGDPGPPYRGDPKVVAGGNGRKPASQAPGPGRIVLSRGQDTAQSDRVRRWACHGAEQAVERTAGLVEPRECVERRGAQGRCQRIVRTSGRAGEQTALPVAGRGIGEPVGRELL